jgi:hypothetical protein
LPSMVFSPLSTPVKRDRSLMLRADVFWLDILTHCLAQRGTSFEHAQAWSSKVSYSKSQQLNRVMKSKNKFNSSSRLNRAWECAGGPHHIEDQSGLCTDPACTQILSS